jgi:hypothetical protein
MNPVLKSWVLCSCFCVSSMLAVAQATTCAADGDTTQGSAIGCVTGEGVVVKAAAESVPQTPEVLPLTPEQRPAMPPTVTYLNGKLTIIAKNANLGEILRVVGDKTGAAIDVPEEANERVVSQLGPGAPRDVIAALLNGSHYNYVVLGNEADPNAVARVVLTSKSDHGASGANSPAAAMTVAERATIQPRTALQQAVIQPYQEMLQQQQAQPLNVPDFQQQAQVQAPATVEPATQKEQASAGSEVAPAASVSTSAGTETATVEPPSATDGADKSANGERTPQQMLQGLYETRRQMMQQQQQQRIAHQQPPQ